MLYTDAVHTYYVIMNLTLSIDDRLLVRARELARKRGLSLNQMVRNYLEEVTSASAPDSLASELERLWSESEIDSGGRDWKREDLYDRTVLR